MPRKKGNTMRWHSKFKQTMAETTDFKPDLLMARLHEASGDLKAAELHYRQAAKQAHSKELKEELYRLADNMRQVIFTSFD
jgi:hypothetical protein